MTASGEAVGGERNGCLLSGSCAGVWATEDAWYHPRG